MVAEQQGLKVNQIFEQERARQIAEATERERRLSQLRYTEEQADIRLGDISEDRTNTAVKYGIAGLFAGGLIAFLVRKL